MTWKRFVAIGDSFTEGLDDLGTNGLYVGWADRASEFLATQEKEFTYANLAIRGRRLDDILGQQLDRALEMKPDLVSIVGGGNDMLRPRWDLPTLAGQIEDGVTRTRASGADVLLIGFPPMSGHSNLLGLIDNRNFALRQVASRLTKEYGCYYVDLWNEEIFQDKRLWAPDRLHMNSEGHRRVASAVLQALGLGDGQWRLPLPPQGDVSLPERLERDVSWFVRHAGPWVSRRIRGTSSGDELLPKRETPHRVRVHKPVSD